MKEFIFVMESADSDVWLFRSSSLVNLDQANRLQFLFENYSGRILDFGVYLTPKSKDKTLLSHLIQKSIPVSLQEKQVLKKFGLLHSGFFTPLDLLEEFEAQMGEILEDKDTQEFYLEGEKETFMEEEE